MPTMSTREKLNSYIVQARLIDSPGQAEEAARLIHALAGEAVTEAPTPIAGKITRGLWKCDSGGIYTLSGISIARIDLNESRTSLAEREANCKAIARVPLHLRALENARRFLRSRQKTDANRLAVYTSILDALGK